MSIGAEQDSVRDVYRFAHVLPHIVEGHLRLANHLMPDVRQGLAQAAFESVAYDAFFQINPIPEETGGQVILAQTGNTLTEGERFPEALQPYSEGLVIVALMGRASLYTVINDREVPLDSEKAAAIKGIFLRSKPVGLRDAASN